MGEEPGRMSSEAKPARRQVDEIEQRIEQTRSRLSASVAELDRRRHQLTNFTSASGILLVAAVAVLGGGVLWIAVRNHRHRQKPVTRAKRLLEAIRLLSENPDRAAGREPPAARKILIPAGTAAATRLARGLVGRTFGRSR